MATETHYQEPQTWYHVHTYAGTIVPVTVFRETATRVLYQGESTRRCQIKEVWAYKKSGNHAFFPTLDQARAHELSCLREDLDRAKMEVVECQEKIERTLDSYQREDKIAKELTSATV